MGARQGWPRESRLHQCVAQAGHRAVRRQKETSAGKERALLPLTVDRNRGNHGTMWASRFSRRLAALFCPQAIHSSKSDRLRIGCMQRLVLEAGQGASSKYLKAGLAAPSCHEEPIE